MLARLFMHKTTSSPGLTTTFEIPQHRLFGASITVSQNVRGKNNDPNLQIMERTFYVLLRVCYRKMTVVWLLPSIAFISRKRERERYFVHRGYRQDNAFLTEGPREKERAYLSPSGSVLAFIIRLGGAKLFPFIPSDRKITPKRSIIRSLFGGV